MALPERILQFGGGNFVRAFVDVFVHEANVAGQEVGGVVVVQSTASQRAQLLNDQQGRYHVVTRGLVNGAKIDQVQEIRSVTRGLVAQAEWDAVLAVATSPALRLIVSNVTEAGYALADGEQLGAGAPVTFPAKLLTLLHARYQAGQGPVTILPCELLDQNGDRLLALVLEQAARWELTGPFLDWLRREVYWLNTLVDRIVSGRPSAHPLLAHDELLTVAEPFALWVIAAHGQERDLFAHPAMQVVADVGPYSLRKVRILNGAHTALVAKAMPRGIETVREAVTDSVVGPWLRRVLFEEIVPTVADRVEAPAAFAEQVLERFANPYLEHKLSAIALHHETKVQVRLLPTYQEYQAHFGHKPPLLAEILEG